MDNEISEPNWKDRIEVKYTEIKEHVRRNKTAYTVGTTGIVLVIATFFVTRRVYGPNAFLAKKIVIKDSVLIFSTYARKQGPPSYVVRCVETKRIFTSQAEAARGMGLDPSDLSKHLNEIRDHVKGYHFTRVAIATPRSG